MYDFKIQKNMLNVSLELLEENDIKAQNIYLELALNESEKMQFFDVILISLSPHLVFYSIIWNKNTWLTGLFLWGHYNIKRYYNLVTHLLSINSLLKSLNLFVCNSSDLTRFSFCVRISSNHSLNSTCCL